MELVDCTSFEAAAAAGALSYTYYIYTLTKHDSEPDPLRLQSLVDDYHKMMDGTTITLKQM